MSVQTSAEDDASDLSLLASSIAGRRLVVRTGHDGLTYTDGETIYLASDAGADAVTSVVVQGALLAAGSLDPKLVARVLGRANPARRYLTLEAARAINELDHCAPRTVRAAVKGHWDGVASTSAARSLKRVLDGEPVPAAPEHFGTIRPSKLLRAGPRMGGTPLRDRRSELKVSNEGLPELEDDEEWEESELLKMLTSPLQWKWQNPLSNQLRKRLFAKTSAKVDGQAMTLDESVTTVSVAQRIGPHAVAVADRAGLDAVPSAEPAGDIRYPEWDGQRGIYRPDWCRVGEFDPIPNETADDFMVRPDPGIRRELARLGLAFRRSNRQHEGDSLDSDALVDFAVARAMGETSDQRVYQARLKAAHDLGVVVLLDASGSTGESDASGATVWDRQRVLAAHLVAGLEEVGDRVAAYGFASRGRNQVRFWRIKDFDGRFDSAARSRLRDLQPAGFTRIGAAIRHSVHLAATQAGTSNRLLVVISDGFPYDDDYQDRYAEQDTRQALTEAVNQAVACVCLSVGSSTDSDVIERLWGHVSHVGLVEPAELGRHLLPLFRSALKAANGQTRTTQANNPRKAFP